MFKVWFGFIRNSRFKIEQLNTDVGANTIWLGVNSIKLSLCGGELGGGELAMGRNRQLPPREVYV